MNFVYIVFSKKDSCIVAVFSKKKDALKYINHIKDFDYTIEERMVL